MGASQNWAIYRFILGRYFRLLTGRIFHRKILSFADAKFTYPFIADLIAASFYKVGASVQNAMFLQNLFLGFSLAVLLEKFVFRLTNNRLAGKFAPLILLFSGGLGFGIWSFGDFWQGSSGFLNICGIAERFYDQR